MISTGIAGTPFQSYSPKSASWILEEDVGLQRAAHLEDALTRPHHRGIAHGHPGHLHREVRLDGGGEIRGAAREEIEAAVVALAPPQVLNGLLLAAAIHPIDQVTEQEVFGRDRCVGFELADPMTVRCLE